MTRARIRGVERRLAIVAALVVTAAAGTAAAKPVLVQDNWGDQDGAGHVTCKWNKNIGTGDLLIATVTYSGGSNTTIMPQATNGGGKTWTEIPAGHAENGSVGVRVYYSLNATANTTKPTESWTVSPSTAEVVLELHEFSGVLTSGALDASAVAVGTTTAPNLNATTSTSTAEMTFTVMGFLNATANPGTPTNSALNYTNITSAGTGGLGNTAVPNPSTTRTRSSYILVTSTSSGSVQAKLAALPAGTTNWAAAVVTFQLTSLYWIGAGSYPARPGTPDPATCYGYFDDDACWSSTSGGPNNVASPAANDVVVVDGGGGAYNGNLTFSPLTPGTESAYSIEVKSTYSGTLNMTDQAGVSPDLQTGGPLLLTGGTWNVNAAQLTVGTTVTMNGSGATFNGASGTETFNGVLTVQAGTMYLGPSPTLTGNTQIGTSGSAATSGSLILSSGTVSFPGTVTVDGTTSVLNLGTANVTISNNVLVDFGGTINPGASGTKTFSTRILIGTTGNSPTGNLTFPTGSSASITINGSNNPSFRLQAGAVFDASLGGGAITFGNGNSAGQSAITITSGTLNLAGAASASVTAGDVTLSAGSMTLPSGSFTFPGALTANGTFDVGGNSSLTVKGNLTVNGGTFHSRSTNLDLQGTTTMQNAFSFDSVSAVVTFENTIALSGTGMLDLSATTPSITSGTVTVGSGTTLRLGSQALTFPSDVSVSGTFTSGTGNLTFQGAITNGNGSLDLTSPGTLTFSSNLFKVSGGATTFGSQTVTIPGPVQVTSGSMTYGSGMTQLQGTYTQSGGTTNLGSGPSTIQGAYSQSGGNFNAGSGTLALQSTITETGGNFNCVSSTVTVAGSTSISGGSTFNAPTSNVALTFNGQVTVGASDGTRGILNINKGKIHFAYAAAGGATSVLLEGGTTAAKSQINNATTGGGATIDFGENAATGTTALSMTSVALGTDSVFVDLSDVATVTFHAGQINIGANHLLTMNANTATLTFPELVTVAGTLTGSSNAMTFDGPLSVSGTMSGGAGSRTFNGAVTSSGTTNVSAASGLTWGGSSSLTVTAGTTTFGTYSNALTTVPSLSVTGGTFDATNGGTGNGTRLTISGTTSVSGAGIANLATKNIITLNGAVTISGTGSLTLGNQPEALNSTLDVSGTGAGASFTAGSGAVTIAGGVTVHTGGTVTLGGGTESLQSTLDVPGGTFTVGSGNATITGPTTATASGVINGGSSGALSFTNAVTFGAAGPGSIGTFNGGSSKATFSSGVTVQGGSTFNSGSGTMTFNGVFSLLTSSTLNGNTAAGTFNATPVLTNGTFSVGDPGTAKVWTYAVAAGTMTVSQNVTLAFPTTGGELSFKNGNGVSIDGTVTSSAGAVASRPKIDCNGCVGGAGFTVNFTANAQLQIDGMTFDHVGGTGVTIASGVTYTKFKNIKFTNNGTGSTSQLTMTLGNQVLPVPGCYFDGSATHNVTLNGTMTAIRGARAIFESQGSSVNGSGAGNANDADGDKGANGDLSANDNYVDGASPPAPYYGSVIEWVNASPTDTTGTAVGFPTAAFDWNTFAYYGVYASYKNASNGDSVLWLRYDDNTHTYGAPAYSFTVDHTTSGDLIGTPYWDTINETTSGIDADGDGLKDKTHVHVVYLATTAGHIIKLVDNGSGLARPGSSSVWNTDFTDGTVTAIDSPLANDLTNLYFGGRNGSSPNVYAVQIASGNEKVLVRTVGAASVVTTTPSWATSGGSTYVFLGSNVSGGTAYIYRINMTNGTIDANSPYSGAMTSLNGAIVIQNSHAYAVSDAGKVYALDALNFATGGFTNITGFPYQTPAASPIKFSAWVGPDSVAMFGDNAGNVYDLKANGTLDTGYPVSLGATQVTSTPIYRQASGVIGIGAADGYLYFIDRSSASIFKRFFVTQSGSVSSVSYDKNIPAFMVSSSDGKLVFINASDVTDPTSGSI